MAKRRLLQSMRDRLYDYANGNVSPAAETKAYAAAYKKAEPLVRKIVEAKYKPSDMEVCAKYELTKPDTCIRVQFPNGVVEEFNFASVEAAPIVATARNCYSRMYLSDEKTADAIEVWKTARDNLTAEKRKRVAAYKALIDGSNYVEDIAVVWPEIANLFPPENALIALGPEQIALVQADLKERKAA